MGTLIKITTIFIAYSPYWGQNTPPYYLPLPGANAVFPLSSSNVSSEQIQTAHPTTTTHVTHNRSFKPSPAKTHSKASHATVASTIPFATGSFPGDVKVYHHTMNQQNTSTRGHKQLGLPSSRQPAMFVVATASQHTQHSSPPLQTVPQSVVASSKHHHSQNSHKVKNNSLIHHADLHTYSANTDKTHMFQPENSDVCITAPSNAATHYSKVEARSIENNNNVEYYAPEGRDIVNVNPRFASNDTNKSKNGIVSVHTENTEYKSLNESVNTNANSNNKNNYNVSYTTSDANSSDSHYVTNHIRETSKIPHTTFHGRTGPRYATDRATTSGAKRPDFNRNGNYSSRNTPSSNSTSSSNTSAEHLYNMQPNYQQSIEMQHDPHAFYIARSVLPPIPTHISDAYQPMTYNSNPGMYVKLGSQAYVTHVSVTFQNYLCKTNLVFCFLVKL